jgi:chemotaxis protein methyltransferase CheR
VDGRGGRAGVTTGRDVARFRVLLARLLGWSFDDNAVDQLARVLRRRTDALNRSADDYLVWLGGTDRPDELAVLVQELGITETYFFRHEEQIRALADEALPERIQARAAVRVLRMLSVGCSSGEEAYSLAILAREAQPDPAWTISVLGLDANAAMLRVAAVGRYPAWSLRETPDSARQRWFHRDDDGRYEIDPELRGDVQFRQHNVADDDPRLWQPGEYDVIFCRNLLMYLTPAVGGALVRRITHALTPGGFLFLGHTDTLGSRPEGLEPRQSHHTFYYRRPRSSSMVAPAPRPQSRRSPARRKVAPPLAGPEIRDQALALLRDERFADALDVVEAGLPRQPAPADVLLHGVLLAQTGRLEDAEILCRRLLDTDGLYADAHQLLATCLEDGAAVDVAIGHYRLAAYLDPAFAMPRLRLGLLLRRRGDHAEAGAELDRALPLLREERDERITLFGGGFGRTALTALCRAELDASGVWR